MEGIEYHFSRMFFFVLKTYEIAMSNESTVWFAVAIIVLQ